MIAVRFYVWWFGVMGAQRVHWSRGVGWVH